jgi:hypothetical protein
MEYKFSAHIGGEEPNVTPQNGVSLDFAEGCDAMGSAFLDLSKGVISVSHTINDWVKWFEREHQKFLRAKKALLWAVTHGYIALVNDTKHCNCYKSVSTPKELKRFFRSATFIIGFMIFSKDYVPCKIKKGRVSEINVWPYAIDCVDEMEKLYTARLNGSWDYNKQ